MTPSTIGWIQRAKGWGILFIVLGHVAGGGFHLASAGIAEPLAAIYKYFYSFHIELFVFLAGLTYSVSGKPFVTFLQRKAQSLLIPYWFWGLISFAIFLGSSGTVAAVLGTASTSRYYHGIFQNMEWWTPLAGMLHGGGWPNGNGFRHNSVLWFLICLFTLEIGYYPFERWVHLRHRYVWSFVLFALCGLCIRACGIQGWPLAIPRAIVLGAFFSLGRLYGRERAAAPVERGAVTSCLLLSMLLVIVGCAMAAGNVHTDHATSIRKYALFLITATISIGGWCGVSRFTGGRWTEWLGTHSLAIMVMHKFLVVGLQTKIPLIRHAYRASVAEAMVATAVVTVVALVACGLAGAWLARHAPWTVGKASPRKRPPVGAAIRAG